MNIRKMAGSLGLAGIGIVFLSSLVTALFFRGLAGERYSPLNHYISELGWPGVSQLAPFFNLCLTAGGLLLAGFLLGLGLYYKTRLAYLAAAAGVLCGLACALVGVFPMNNLATHVPVATAFFASGMLVVALLTAIILLDRHNRLPKWLAIFGLLSILSFASFLALPYVTGMTRPQTLDPSHFQRPAVWPITIMEWAIFVTFMLWALLTSWQLVGSPPSHKTGK